jgi:hypothetical protein
MIDVILILLACACLLAASLGYEKAGPLHTGWFGLFLYVLTALVP